MYSSVCRVLGWIVLILGIIGTLMVIRNTNSFTLLIAGGLATSIQSAVLFSLGYIIDAIEELYYNVDSIYNNVLDSTPKRCEWKCSDCGRTNPPFIGTCVCGNDKH